MPWRVYANAFRGLPRDVWTISLVLLVNRSGTMVLPFLSLYLTERRGLSLATAGALVSLYGVGSAAGSFLGGWCSDRFGPVRTQLLTLVASGFAFLAMSEMRSIPAIAVGLTLLSVISEALRPAAMTAMAERAPEAVKVRAFALLRLAANVGMGIGPALGGVLAVYSYRWLFVADAATCWLAALLLWATTRLEDRSAGSSTDGAGRSRSPWTDGPFLVFVGLVSVLAMVFFQFFGTLPVYLRDDYGLRKDVIGALLASNAWLIVLFEMPLVQRAERWDRFAATAVGMLLLCVGFGLLPLGSSVPWAAFTIVVWTIGEMLAFPMMNALVAERAPPGSRGRYMGAYMVAFSVALMVAPAGGMAIYARFGPSVLWYTAGALGVPLAAAAWGLRHALASRGGPSPAPARGGGA